MKQKIRKIVPIITWVPWNPVVTKNLDPKQFSLKEKEASKYSKACKLVKINPNKIVQKREKRESSPLKRLWWDQVTVTPLKSKTQVFRRGTWKGSIQNRLNGGHIDPKSFPGFKLLWKKAQNQAEKNNTSEKINKSIPHFNPSRTSKLWNPLFLSRLTSRHQENEKEKSNTNIKNNKAVFLVLKKINRFKIILKVNKDTKKGQGLNETKWNLWKFILKEI